MSITTAVRTPVAAKVREGVLQLRVRSGGPADPMPEQIANQVLAMGWVELRSDYPLERVFRGRPGA